MRWFRMYGEMPDDPKIGTLNDADFRTWVELLCLACREDRCGATSATDENINWLLRRNVTGSLPALLQRGLIHRDKGGQYVVSKWAERQKPSDSSAERVRKHREKSRAEPVPGVTVTLQAAECNAVEKKREEKKKEGSKRANALYQGERI